MLVVLVVMVSTAIGFFACANTTADNSMGIGYNALSANTSGGD